MSHIYISTAEQRHRGGSRYRVAVKEFRGWNSLDRTLAERDGLSMKGALAQIADYQRMYRAPGGEPLRVQGSLA